MATITPTDNLEIEIQQLKGDLRNAELARVRPEDAAADRIREQLLEKQRELYQQQEFEAAAAAEQQHALQLLNLVQVENDISKAKAEVNTLRTMLNELPGRLSRAQWQLDQLLRSHSQLKAELKG